MGFFGLGAHVNLNKWKEFVTMLSFSYNLWNYFSFFFPPCFFLFSYILLFPLRFILVVATGSPHNFWDLSTSSHTRQPTWQPIRFLHNADHKSSTALCQAHRDSQPFFAVPPFLFPPFFRFYIDVKTIMNCVPIHL